MIKFPFLYFQVLMIAHYLLPLYNVHLVIPLNINSVSVYGHTLMSWL